MKGYDWNIASSGEHVDVTASGRFSEAGLVEFATSLLLAAETKRRRAKARRARDAHHRDGVRNRDPHHV